MLDNLIFALAPLGIITIIVGAIRTSGPAKLRALIGRARENDAAAEVEYLSSVSHEVCEVWNGHSIVRIPGSPDIKLFVYIEHEDIRDEGVKDRTFGLFTLTGGENERGPLTCKDFGYNSSLKPPSNSGAVKSALYTSWFEKRKPPGDEESNGKWPIEKVGELQIQEIHPPSTEGISSSPYAMIDQPEKLASNITLNLSRNRKHQLYIGAIVGIVAQSLVLVLSGLATYHPGWRDKFKKAGAPVQNYAYPLTAIGTFLLVFGVFICASVIEQSTHEHKWTLKSRDKQKDSESNVFKKLRDVHNGEGMLKVFWLQRELTVNDQRFGSYAIISRQPLRTILTSHPLRLFTKAPKESAPLQSMVSSQSSSTTQRHQIRRDSTRNLFQRRNTRTATAFLKTSSNSDAYLTNTAETTLWYKPWS